jgi:hypothetical protein
MQPSRNRGGRSQSSQGGRSQSSKGGRGRSSQGSRGQNHGSRGDGQKRENKAGESP